MSTFTVLGEHRGDHWASVFTETVTLAFKDDPTWSPVVESNADDPDAARRYWEFFVRSSQRFPWMGQSDDGAAVSVWLPPGADELTPEEEDRFPEFAAELFGASRRDELLRIIERFDAARPEGEYFYLSLLATHPTRRGEGLGMRLLESNLRRLDELEAPSYLESSNPVNDKRYQRLGFRPHGTIVLPSGVKLMTLWRDPQPPATPYKGE